MTPAVLWTGDLPAGLALSSPPPDRSTSVSRLALVYWQAVMVGRVRFVVSRLRRMPTILRSGPFRFFFFSNEGREPPHIHVRAGGDEAKFWLDPVALASNYGFNGRELG